jgi:hypothetical protein
MNQILFLIAAFELSCADAVLAQSNQRERFELPITIADLEDDYAFCGSQGLENEDTPF